jgi:hypothetical protein
MRLQQFEPFHDRFQASLRRQSDRIPAQVQDIDPYGLADFSKNLKSPASL